MSYIGNSPVQGPARVIEGSGTGDGSTTSFPMGFAPGSDKEVFVFIDGVKQDTTAYDISGSNCVFTTAPINGENIDFIGYKVGKSFIPQDGSVDLSKISGSLITSSTKIDTTSGTSHDFTNIPSWVKKITIVFEGMSTNGISLVQIQLGNSGGIEDTGYFSSGSSFVSANTHATSTTGLLIDGSHAASHIIHGIANLILLDGNTWVLTFIGGRGDTPATKLAGGTKTLSATLDRIRLTTVNGTDAFDAGSINILYE